jgi:hypothetical protein
VAGQKERANKAGIRNKQNKSEDNLFIQDMWALGGGLLTAGVAIGGQWLIGQIYSGYEARNLIQAMLNSALFFAGSVVTASATILALMLTMLSLSDQTKADFEMTFFHRIEQIGVLTTICLAGGILMLLFLSVPLQESKNVPNHWFTIIYYILIVFLALLAGLLVSIILMLLNSIRSLIKSVRVPQTGEEEEE